MMEKDMLKELYKAKQRQLKESVAAWFNENHGVISLALSVGLLVCSSWSLLTHGFWQSVEYLAWFAIVLYVRVSFKEIENTYEHTVDEHERLVEDFNEEIRRVRENLL